MAMNPASSWWRNLKPVLLGTVVLACLALAVPAVTPTAQARLLGPATDRIKPHRILSGVSAISTTDAWAVGSHTNRLGKHLTLILHSIGNGWNKVSSPSMGRANDSYLKSVSAISGSSAWAVGYYRTAEITRALFERWDGTGWRKIKTHNLGDRPNMLTGVTALSDDDVWAVGNYVAEVRGYPRTLIEHWDGSTWIRVPSPHPGRFGSYLNSISAVSPTDIWAVGYLVTGSSDTRTLIQHWDGTAWSKKIFVRGSLNAVSAVSSNDVWAVGRLPDSVPENEVLHWDGSKWRVVPSADLGGGVAAMSMDGVSGVAEADVWIVGFYAQTGANKPLIEHWDGTSWSLVQVGLHPHAFLNGVSALSDTDAWAVGYRGNGSWWKTVLEHWDGASWTRQRNP